MKASASLAWWACWLAPLAAIAAALPAQAPAAAPRAAVAVGPVGLPVGDLDRSVRFFTGVLAFEKQSEDEEHGDRVERWSGVFGARVRSARLRLGDEQLELVEFLAPRGRAVPADLRGNDRAFQHCAIVVRDMPAAYARLRAHRVEHVSPAPQRLPDWNPAAGGIEAFYFKDPDGHPLELLRFPPGKGDARWHRPSEHLFLGIDHTAITVADTEASLRFYRDGLGLRVAGSSENWGTEQERLNNVFGARLRITTLRADSGPGIELLEYLVPRDGRPAPLDGRSNDLWSVRTVVAVPDVAATARDVAAARAGLGARAPSLLLDPDAHVVELVARSPGPGR